MKGIWGRNAERQLKGLLTHGKCVQEVILGRPWRIVSFLLLEFGIKDYRGSPFSKSGPPGKRELIL